jgi:hypothetical protein
MKSEDSMPRILVNEQDDFKKINIHYNIDMSKRISWALGSWTMI